MISRTHHNLRLAIGTLLCAAAAVADTPVPEHIPLLLAGNTPVGTPFEVRGLELDGGRTVDLELERFEVFAPGALIVHRGENGERVMIPPRDRYFRGSVKGDPDSLVFLAVGRTLRGLIGAGGQLFAVATREDVYRPEGKEGGPFLRRLDPDLDRPPDAAAWTCANDLFGPMALPGANAFARETETAALASSTVYAATLAIETDYELYQILGSADAVATYVGDLVAASSAIYQRDVGTVLRIGSLYTYSTSSDPWTATSMDGALFQLGDYWHANRSGVSRSTVHLLSGKRLGGGIAWVGVICDNDFYYSGHWGGGYGVSANINGSFSTTNPYLYWDILCFSHELGHNFNSDHTHCYSPPVDKCYASESGCYTGLTSVPVEKGTIMSYCHLRSGGYNNIKLFFGVPGEPSEPVLGVIRSYVESRSSCLSVVGTAPTVLAVEPTSGPTIGGTSVTISGSNFQSGASVSLGGVPATDVVVVGPTTITATTCSHEAGTVTIVVTNPDLQTATLPDSFSFVDCDVTVADRTLNEPEEITSPCGIVAGPNVRVTATDGEVTFRAGGMVVLRNGFSVGAGSRFVAGLDSSLLLT